MLCVTIDGTVEIFRSLKATRRYKFYALTNCSAETFPVALQRYDFLKWFDGIVMSGAEKTRKPFPEFYNLLLDRYNVDPSKAIFIDDNLRNVNAGEVVGIKGIHFQSPVQLLKELKQSGII